MGASCKGMNRNAQSIQIESIVDRLPTLLSVRTFAKEIGCSERAVRGWVSSGQVRSLRLGRRRLVPLGELHRLARRGLRSNVGKKAQLGKAVGMASDAVDIDNEHSGRGTEG
jgi:excisionase family DNA binding protein